MSPTSSFDALTVGAGLVGASFALASRQAGLDVALVEGGVPRVPSTDWDSRIYALSPSSVEFLKSLGVWQTLDPSRVQAVERMEIHGDRADARLDFSAYESGVEALAYIVESGRLQFALWQALEQSGVQMLSPMRCVRLDSANTLTLEDGHCLRGELLVGADGANSWLRQAAGIETRTQPYQQRAVVANFRCEKAHAGTAFQWFGADGVLALLPLPGQQVSMVWSTQESHADALLSMDATTLCASVERASSGRVGALEPLTPAQSFSLQMLQAKKIVVPGIALIGDAAHVVHPLAGQGVNLGFGDAEKLAHILRNCEPGRSCGDYGLLRRYERSRAEPVWAMREVTDGLSRFFSMQGDFPMLLRNTGLNLSNRLPVLKTWLVRHALG